MPIQDAVLEAGRRRFRPVILTSITTIAGVLPILLETQRQALVLIPESIRGVVTGTGSPWGFLASFMPGTDFSLPINDWDPPGTVIQPVAGRLGRWGTAGSLHPGGMNLAQADGSIHFVSESIDDSTRLYLHQMNDHQVVAFP